MTMKKWEIGDSIVYTFPNGGNTYRFILDSTRPDGLLQFMSEPERGAMGFAISGGLLLRPEQAEVVWEANLVAARCLKDQLFDNNFRGALSFFLGKGV